VKRGLLLLGVVAVMACGEPSPARVAAPVDTTQPIASASPSASAPASASASASASSRCTPECLGGTHIPGTDENRAVLAFCEVYRRAVEARDVDTLLSLASPAYFEDGGNTDPSDDLDRKGLEAFLREGLSSLSDVHYEFRYRDVRREGDAIVVSYTYAGSFSLKSGQTKRVIDDNELRLERSGDGFVITSGM
jgi:hypothetical protein